MNKKFELDFTEQEKKVSDFTEKEQKLLDRVIEICWEARNAGNNPFGCLLADKEGNILLEQGNEESTLKGDCTAHAETLLMRKASVKFSKEELKNTVMYSCAEPCSMCAGAIYWSSVGKLVYIARESELLKHTGSDPRNPTLNLPCRVVFASGQKEIEVLGPILELEDKFFECHENFWNK